jgi:7-cyano-7-deazaguanine reductase
MNTYDNHASLVNAPLGKKSAYINQYDSSLLFPIPRKIKRDEIGLKEKLPFHGFDIWNGFELSWLNAKGKPVVATAEFQIPCESPNLIESKSFKLYLNSFNNSRFESFEIVSKAMQVDLSKAAGAEVKVNILPLDKTDFQIGTLKGTNIDSLDIECDQYMPQIEYLSSSKEIIEEVLTTDLLKSNCLVTGQPDWGSVQIQYHGPKINPEGLLRYIVSLRDHNEFHEQCVERIFTDILKQCRPERLSVYARYTRRGGLDINPFRSNYLDGHSVQVENKRLARQ